MRRKLKAQRDPGKRTSGIRPRQVRYIKLGRAGHWEKECIEKGIIRYGFDSANADRFPLCCAEQWEELTRSFMKQGKDRGTATNFTNQTRAFFEDDGSTLWITFVGEQMYWGFLEGTPAQRHEDGDGVWRSVAGQWRNTDLNGEKLTTDRLSGALTKLRSYRGTSCGVDVREYVVRRINGQKLPEVENAVAALAKLKLAVQQLLRLLGPRDLEILVDLVFSNSGYRRIGPVGKTQKTLDLDLRLPITDERAFVQVKSRTTSRELATYVSRLNDLGPYDHMFFVYHTGDLESDDDRVTLIGPEKLAELVIEAGLVDWVVRKVT